MGIVVGLFLFLVAVAGANTGKSLVFIAYAPVPPELSGLYRYIDENANAIKEKWNAKVIEVHSYGELVDRMLRESPKNYKDTTVVILGHSDGFTLLDITADSFYLPFKVDLLVLDLCYVGTIERLKSFSRYAYTVIGSDWEIPQYGISPLYGKPELRKSPEELARELGRFYAMKMNQHRRAFKKAGLTALRFYILTGKNLLTVKIELTNKGARATLERSATPNGSATPEEKKEHYQKWLI